MGRFETAAEFYGSREPYSSEFFTTVAERLGLDGRQRLIDLGCGPAPLALGFAPFVKHLVGVDSEPAMLAAGRKNVGALGVDLQLIESRVEALPSSLGRFEVITIGRALHWMDRAGVLGALDRLAAPGGWIAICGAATDVSLNPWAAAFKTLRKRWSSSEDQRRHKMDLDAWSSGSRFRKVDELRIASHGSVSIDEIVRRALSMSSTAPAVLGQRRGDFEADIRSVVGPFARDGMLEENIVCVATLFQ
jgi:SAM-dependent methyltransferase